jgi:hypothetical protein
MKPWKIILSFPVARIGCPAEMISSFKKGHLVVQAYQALKGVGGICSDFDYNLGPIKMKN